MVENYDAIVAIAGGAVGGLAVGVEREWSGHARGPRAHFAGVRTFTLIGGVAAICGQLAQQDYSWLAAVLVGGLVLLVVAAYVAASRQGADGTTEVAALVVIAAGLLAGIGQLALASGVIAVTVLALAEKSRLHTLVLELNDAEIRAGARFAVMAVVILPLLPEGPYGPFGGVRPRELWAVTLLFTAINFIGYAARRIVGAERGYPLVGLLGGLVSSTAVTLNFARTSTHHAAAGLPLAAGAVAASTMLFPRVLVTTSVLSPALAWAVLPYSLPPFVVGAVAVAALLRRAKVRKREAAPASSPLNILAALQMALIFQVVLFVIYLTRTYWGASGVVASSALVGLGDVDALTVSLSKSTSAGFDAGTAAIALAVGAMSNTLVKMTIAWVAGAGRFRTITGGSLLAMAIAGIATILLWR